MDIKCTRETNVEAVVAPVIDNVRKDLKASKLEKHNYQNFKLY